MSQDQDQITQPQQQQSQDSVQPRPKKKRWFLGCLGVAIGLIFLVIIIAILSSGGEEDKSQMTVEKDTPQQEEKQEQNQEAENGPTPSQEEIQSQEAAENTEEQKNYYDVVSVVDGDTIKVNIAGTTEKIRLIGINTPETVDPRKDVECFGLEASNKAKELLSDQKVYLEADESQNDRDKYSRLLRYVFLEDGTHVNLEMIRQGYAYEYTYDSAYKYQIEFKAAQQEAQDNKRGLWADDACVASTSETTSSSPEATSPPQETTPSEPASSPQTEEEPKPTPPPTPAPPSSTPVVCDCSGNIYNCKDFDTHAEAQACHDYCIKTVGYDVHGLDGNDNDGLACESLP